MSSFNPCASCTTPGGCETIFTHAAGSIRQSTEMLDGDGLTPEQGFDAGFVFSKITYDSLIETLDEHGCLHTKSDIQLMISAEVES